MTIVPDDPKKPKNQGFPQCPFEPDEYRDDMKDFDMSKEKQDEVLECLWHIMGSLVDLGWGVNTIQILLPEIFEKASQDSDTLIKQECNQEKGKDND